MSVVTSATISQTASGSVITFTDTSTGLVGTIVRVLNVYDPTGTLIATPIFSGVTATLDVTSDAYFTFVENITDDNGSYTQTKNYLSTAFTDNVIVNTMTQFGCGCSLEQFSFIDVAYFFRFAALRLALGGFGVAAQANIQASYTTITGG